MKSFSVITGICLGALTITPLFAAERKLSGDEINSLLPTIAAIGETTRQTFSARGATTYTDRGRDSYGTWVARGDQYCSQWPPANGWACYDVFVDGASLIWVGDTGNRTITTMKPKG